MADKEVTTGEIMEVLEFMKDNMVTKEEFNDLKSDVSSLKSDVSGLKSDVSSLKSGLSGLRTEIHVDFATKDEVRTMMTEFKDEILTAVDGIAQQHKTFNQELAAIHLQNGRRDQRLETVERKLGLASV